LIEEISFFMDLVTYLKHFLSPLEQTTTRFQMFENCLG